MRTRFSTHTGPDTNIGTVVVRGIASVLSALTNALAGEPRMLLLDEPMAGLWQKDSDHMIEMLRALKENVTIPLVEHDMEAVVELADQVTVLVSGRVIASGLLKHVRVNEEVRRAHLGEEDI